VDTGTKRYSTYLSSRDSFPQEKVDLKLSEYCKGCRGHCPFSSRWVGPEGWGLGRGGGWQSLGLEWMGHVATSHAPSASTNKPSVHHNLPQED
jgi:hypothetical protein